MSNHRQKPPTRTALVTGGTSGIGAAIASMLRSRGFEVSVAGRCTRRGSELAAEDEGMHFIEADLTLAGAPQEVVARAVDKMGRLDVLVNNAGRRHAGMIVETPLDEITEVFALNTFAAMAMTAAAAKVMEKQGDGSIIHVLSRLATVGVATLSTYSASKGALLAYTKAAAVELAPSGIRVNAVAPGMTMTPLIEDWLDEQADPEGALAGVMAAI
ncbi:hypothetical protein GCM10025778_00250 [Paeniglutamicibacter antarcticus]|uniref:SDR family oxidoreductase n=1 Tax=Paeniglutamicibacter antarcticus TaxID=494023 RepID=A0ABP9TH46_9MICC